jgi:hypothetical protein
MTGFEEPEERFEPSTFRLRGGIFQSNTSEHDEFSQARMGALSIQTDPDRSSQIVGMTMQMTKGAFDSASNVPTPDPWGAEVHLRSARVVSP